MQRQQPKEVAGEYGLKTAGDIGKEQRAVIKGKGENALRGLKIGLFDGFERAVEEQGLKIDRYYHHEREQQTFCRVFLTDGYTASRRKDRQKLTARD